MNKIKLDKIKNIIFQISWYLSIILLFSLLEKYTNINTQALASYVALFCVIVIAVIIVIGIKQRK